MPALKKKGAIFAIYNDSPVASTSQAPLAPTSPTRRPGAATKRKALAAVQPIVPAKRTVLGSEKKEKAVAETAKAASTVAAPASRKVLGKVTDKENVNPAQSPKTKTTGAVKPTTTTAPRGVKKGTLVAKSVAGSRAKRYEVEWDPDPVLGDVSAVYGADPSNEPAGFKDVDAVCRARSDCESS
jgi:hypothetical protein